MALCCFSFSNFFFLKGNKLKGFDLIRLLKDKNYPGLVWVGMGSRLPFSPRSPNSLSATSRRPKARLYLLHPRELWIRLQEACTGRNELQNPNKFWFSNCAPQNTLMGHGWVLGCEERRKPNLQVLDTLPWLEQLSFYLLGFFVWFYLKRFNHWKLVWRKWSSLIL